MRQRLFGAGDRPSGARDEQDVNVVGVRQLAHAADRVERAVAVGVDEYHVWTLHRHARDEHRERNVDDGIAPQAQRLRRALGLDRGIAHEHGRDGTATAAVLEPCSARQALPPVARAIRSEARTQPLADTGQESRAPDEREDEDHEDELAPTHREHAEYFIMAAPGPCLIAALPRRVGASNLAARLLLTAVEKVAPARGRGGGGPSRGSPALPCGSPCDTTRRGSRGSPTCGCTSRRRSPASSGATGRSWRSSSLKDGRSCRIGSLPAHVKLAILAAEDAGFYEHQGLNYWGIARAMLVNLRSGGTRQGGSTITQQVVKNLLLNSRERTFSRKIREALLSRRLEQDLTKDEILELYVNNIYLGRGRYGIEEAARDDTGKSAKDLSIAEAALIAGRIANPRDYHPRASAALALGRRGYVLGQMREKGFLSDAQWESATQEPRDPRAARRRVERARARGGRAGQVRALPHRTGDRACRRLHDHDLDRPQAPGGRAPSGTRCARLVR